MTRLFIAVEQTVYFSPEQLTETLLSQKTNACENFESLAMFLFRIKYLSERDYPTKFWIFEIEVDKAHCEIDERKHLQRNQNRNVLFKLLHANGIIKVISHKCYGYEDLKKFMPINADVGQMTDGGAITTQRASNDGQYGLIAGLDSKAGPSGHGSPMTAMLPIVEENESTPFLPHQEIEIKLTKYREWLRAYHSHTMLSLVLYKLLSVAKAKYKTIDYESFNSIDFHRRKNYLLHHFVNGIEVSSRIAFPLVQAALLAHDFYFYNMQPRERYGQTVSRILLGVSNEEFVLSNNLGSTLISDPNYWIWSSSLLGFPLVVGGLNSLLHFSVIKKFAADLKLGLARELESNLDIYAAHDLLAWGDDLTPQLRAKLQTHLCGRALEGNFLALRQLADIAESAFEHPAALALVVAARSKKRFLYRSYANYLLWSLGRNDQLILDFVFWPLTLGKDLIATYALMHFIEIFFIKLLSAGSFAYQKLICEATDQVWSYLPAWGDYFCSACGDWSFVYQGDVFNPQSCWNELLALPRNASQITTAIQRFATNEFVQNIDLSQQNWNQWLLPDWDVLLNRIQTSLLTVGVFNLSNTIVNPYFTNRNNINALNSFLSSVPVSNLDLSNQGLGDNLVMDVFTALENSSITSLDLSGNNISDQGLQFIAGHIPSSLNTLNVSNNLITDFGLEQFFSNIAVNCGLGTINLSYNRLSVATPQIIASAIPSFPISEIDISGHDFSQTDFSPLWQNCTNPTARLNSLTVANANLGDLQLGSINQYLGNISITEFYFSNNVLSDQSIASFIEFARNTTVARVDFSSNMLGDYSIQILANYISQTNIRYLGVARGTYSMVNMPQFIRAVAQSQVSEMSLAGNLLGNSLVEVLANNLVQTNASLKSLDLSSNAITTEGVAALSNILQDVSITTLNLNNNQIGCMSINTTEHLEVLNLAGNPINDDCLNSISLELPQSNLRQISLAQTSISDNGTIAFAKALVSPIEQAEDLSLPKINFDLRRSLYHLKRATNLTQFDLGENLLSDSSARAMCRVLHGAQISWNHISLTPSLLGATNDLANCQTSHSSTLQPPFILRAPRDAIVEVAQKTRRFKDDFFKSKLRANPHYFYHPAPSLNAANNSRYISDGKVGASQCLLASMITGVIPALLIIIVIVLICRYVVPAVANLGNKISFWRFKENNIKKLTDKLQRSANDAEFCESQNKTIPQYKQ